MNNNKLTETIRYLQRSLQKTKTHVLTKHHSTYETNVLNGYIDEARKCKICIGIIEAYLDTMRDVLKDAVVGATKSADEEWLPYYNRLVLGVMDTVRKLVETQHLVQAEIIHICRYAACGTQTFPAPAVLPKGTVDETQQYSPTESITMLCTMYSQLQVHIKGLLFHLDKMADGHPAVDPAYEGFSLLA